jgi:hypothetical protein
VSINRDCYACMTGKHEDHNPTEGLRKGLIGGTRCSCTGDCKERAEKAYKRFTATVNEVDPI